MIMIMRHTQRDTQKRHNWKSKCRNNGISPFLQKPLKNLCVCCLFVWYFNKVSSIFRATSFCLFLIVKHVNYGDLCEKGSRMRKAKWFNRFSSAKVVGKNRFRKSWKCTMFCQNWSIVLHSPSHRRNRFYPRLISITFEACVHSVVCFLYLNRWLVCTNT